MKYIKLGHILSFFMLRKVFSDFFSNKQWAPLKVQGFLSPPLPCNGKFECSVHIYRGPCLAFSHGQERMRVLNMVQLMVLVWPYSLLVPHSAHCSMGVPKVKCSIFCHSVILAIVCKAKLLQEATFFIVIFTYLEQINRSKMAMEYSTHRLLPCI